MPRLSTLFPTSRYLLFLSCAFFCITILPSFSLLPVDPPPAKRSIKKKKKRNCHQQIKAKKWRTVHKKTNQQEGNVPIGVILGGDCVGACRFSDHYFFDPSYDLVSNSRTDYFVEY